MDLTTETEPSVSSKSLESKIHSFLQGNTAFNAFDLGFPRNTTLGGDSLSPVTGADTQGGTPVRDEGGGTPTQDEIMDKPAVVPFASNIGETAKTAPIAYQNSTQRNNLHLHAHMQPGVSQNGQPYAYGKQDMSEHGITAPAAHYHQISAQAQGPVPGERAPGGAGSMQTAEGFQGSSERSWFGDTFPGGGSQQPGGYHVPGGARENQASGHYPYQSEPIQKPQGVASLQGGTGSSPFYASSLPPVPKLPPPPPPHGFDAMIPPEQQQQQPFPGADAGIRDSIRARVDSVLSGLVIHDHQHKSSFHPDERMYDTDQHRPRHPPEDLRPRPDDLHYQEEPERYHGDPHQHDPAYFEEDPYHHPDDSYYGPDSPQHPFPRGQGRLMPPLSPSEDPYHGHDFQQHNAPPPHYAPRRPPPFHEMRHPGLRPPPRPPHPAHHPRPRGPPRPPFLRFHGPDPRLRGKRPGPRGGGPMFPPKRPFLPPRY